MVVIHYYSNSYFIESINLTLHLIGFISDNIIKYMLYYLILYSGSGHSLIKQPTSRNISHSNDLRRFQRWSLLNMAVGVVDGKGDGDV